MSEIVSIFDINQFGKSPDTCGPAAVALMSATNRPNISPVHDATWVVTEMANLYTQFIGPDIPTDLNGTTMQNLYDMIHAEGFHYQNLFPDGGIAQEKLKDEIRAWVHKGYPVILAVTEDSVLDLGLNRKPYAWDTTGFNHIISVTGIADNGIDFLVRDTANVQASGPRTYGQTQLSIISATIFGVSWLDRPTLPVVKPPVSSPPVVVGGPLWTDELLFYWNYTALGLPNDTGIATSYANAYHQKGYHFGSPVGREVQVKGVGTIMCFTHADCIWNGKQGNWYGANGWIGTF